MMASRSCRGAVPVKTLPAKTLPAKTLPAKTLPVKTLLVKTLPAKTQTSYMARCCRAGAVLARAQCSQRWSRPCGSAWAYVYNVLPCGVRVRRGVPPLSGMPRYRAPGSLTGDCPNARERALRQRIQ